MTFKVQVKVDKQKIRRLEASLRRVERRINGDVEQGLNQAFTRMEVAAKSSALRRLPKRGGLARDVAASRFERKTRRRGFFREIRLEASGPYDLQRIDEGTVRHPIFGHSPWIHQRVPAGWFSDPAREVAESAGEKIESLIARTVSLVQ